MRRAPSFDERFASKRTALSPAEQRVIEFFAQHREEVMVSSASALAEKTSTSDATVIRATKGLGYLGMDELRRQLADELRVNLSPATRLARTLNEVGDDLNAAFDLTLDTHLASLEKLRRDISPGIFRNVIESMVAARRVFVFGIGPSSSMAEYFTVQLCRFGLEATSLTQTGLLLADGMHRLRNGDLLILLAYGRIYEEIEALLDHAKRLKLVTILMTDTLAGSLRHRVDHVLPVARGRAEMLSMHTATLGLIEALLVGIATQRPTETVSSLKSLNALRKTVVGQPMDLSAHTVPAATTGKSRRKKP